ncbi:hypothetical protein [Parasphingopyxis marina]|uniref:TIR domain-containing protein n=1 Tax=Parasphingopyxis marina TaxID=2761622 RepID=A0A842HWH5_9SPHN|nr:hypothetical protein [Parasphingopyxis marina]MBC2778458.1 hypothetical protein [Parasphingopyxis marina]
MTDVVIVHAQEDRARAQALAAALSMLDIAVAWDGEAAAAAAVIALWSQDSVACEAVRAAARDASSRETLVSVQIDECRLPFELRLIHTEYLGVGAEDSGDPVWHRVLERIGELVGRPGLGLLENQT